MTTKAELQKKVDELKAQIDAMEDGKPVKRTGRVMSVDELEDRQGVIGVSMGGDAFAFKYDNTASDGIIKQGNAFHDRESAEREVKRRDIMQRVRVAASESGECDWGDVTTHRYSIVFDHDPKVRDLVVMTSTYYQAIGSIYFATREAAQAFIDSLTDEEIEILREVV